MIEITDKNQFGVYELGYNSNDTLTGVPITCADGTVIQNMTTNSVAINCETRDAKFYDRESNSWK